MTAFYSQVPVSEGDHCHVIYEDRNKYRESMCVPSGVQGSTQDKEIQHSTELMLINRHVETPHCLIYCVSVAVFLKLCNR